MLWLKAHGAVRWFNTCRYVGFFVGFFFFFFFFFRGGGGVDNIFHLDVHYVCMLIQRFEPQGRRFTNFHYYYYKKIGLWRCALV